MNLHIAIKQKSYSNGFIALKDIVFQAQAGEFVALVGPSGAGKSTLLNLLAGLDTDYQGHIQLPNHAKANADNALASDLAFMFQEPRLMPWLSVWDNIHLVIPASQRNLMMQRRLQVLLEQVGLAAFANSYPQQLSGGMKRRVALVRAFILQPALLLMDEPFQSLDAPTAEQLRNLLLTLWQEAQSTVIFVTHSLHEALMLADRVIFLSACPARIILQYPIQLTRPRALEGAEVHQLYQQLLQQYPHLLSGDLALPVVEATS